MYIALSSSSPFATLWFTSWFMVRVTVDGGRTAIGEVGEVGAANEHKEYDVRPLRRSQAE